MNQDTIKKYNLDLYDMTETIGKYDIPKLYSVEYMPNDLLGFNYVTNTTDKSIGVHFFLDDYQIERIWNRPEFYINKLKDFDCVLTPDFSLYSDMPKSMMIWNTYRSRLIGQLMQKAGIIVIPTVSWADEKTFDFCFDGLPQKGTLAISTIGVRRKQSDYELWQSGVDEMIERCKPRRLMIYGDEVDYQFPENIVVRYYENKNISRLKRLGNGR
ncbi:DUF4417 domain-containing protein [Ligilactobacillus salivarius]|uniref:DUF4417 domain-containing protein n=1 Tax=Ligilactobacillus salivarius TaxID=1624 RepID=UPI00195B15F0|nr:DUF4417 domain-containing protein [Ligilactobacillus salivarius]MBM6956739.1 DUF4417 domain-containing protein [Ligilactobacillus salivarius]MDM8272810.1 DUF4417 domain-containing protein [Ligilactobacillus salivarius]